MVNGLSKNFIFLEEVFSFKNDDFKIDKNKLNLIKDTIEKIEDLIFSTNKNIDTLNIEKILDLTYKIIENIFNDEFKEYENLEEKINCYFDIFPKYQLKKYSFLYLINERKKMKNAFDDDIYMKENFNKHTSLCEILKKVHEITLWFVNKSNDGKEYKYNENILDYSIYYNVSSQAILTNEEKKKEKLNLGVQSNDIEIDKYSIVKFLLEEKREIVIPVYQRGYDWGNDNLDHFINDILLRMEDKKLHYFGLIAIKSAENNIDDIKKIRLIDGQQRLTTTMLLMKVLRDINKNNGFNYEEKNPEFYNFFKKELNLTNKIYNPAGTSDGNDSFRMVLSNTYSFLENHFKYDISTNKFKSKNINHIVKNYFYLYKKVYELLKEQEDRIRFFDEFVKILINNFQIGMVYFDETRIKRKQELEIFQNLNSKGKMLEMCDFIKNYLLNLCDENTINDEDNNDIEKKLASKYNLYIKNLFGDRKCNDELNTFYKIFCQYNLGNEETISTPLKITTTFSKSFDIFLRNKKTLKTTNLSLEEFDIVMSLINIYLEEFLILTKKKDDFYLIDKTGKMKILTKVVDNKKNILFIPLFYLFTDIFLYNKELDAQNVKIKVENYFTEYSNIIYELVIILIKHIIIHFKLEGQGDSDFKRNILKVFHDMRERYFDEQLKIEEFPKFLMNGLYSYFKESKKELKEKFKYELINTESSEWVSKTLLLLIELDISTTKSGTQSSLLGVNEIDLEHIMPKEYKDKWIEDMKKWNKINDDEELEIEHKKYLNKLGNFLLLNKSTNSSLKNKCYSEKITSYETKGISNLFINKSDTTTDFGIQNIKEWSFEEIEKRTNILVNYIINHLYKKEFS